MFLRILVQNWNMLAVFQMFFFWGPFLKPWLRVGRSRPKKWWTWCKRATKRRTGCQFLREGRLAWAERLGSPMSWWGCLQTPAGPPIWVPNRPSARRRRPGSRATECTRFCPKIRTKNPRCFWVHLSRPPSPEKTTGGVSPWTTFGSKRWGYIYCRYLCRTSAATTRLMHLGCTANSRLPVLHDEPICSVHR